VIAAAIGVGVTMNIAAIAVFLLANGETSAGILAVGVALIAGVAAVIYLVTGSTAVMARTQISVGVIGVLSMHVALGGYAWSGGWLAWGLSHTAIVALFFSRIEATVVVAIYTVAGLAFVFLESTFQVGRSGPPDVLVPAVLAADTLVINLFLLLVLTTMLLGLVRREQRTNLDLLRNVLPAAIVTRLKESPGVIADRFDECSVLFADLVGFTAHSTEVSPDRLVEELNEVFSRFDGLVADLGAEKIKTIGDGYMAVAGVPVSVDHPSEVVCDLAIAMQAEMPMLNQDLGTGFQLRVGVTTGKVAAGVIGTLRFSYDLWGDTVNLASRLQKLAEPGQVLVSESVVAACGDAFEFTAIGSIDVRGRGETPVFALVGRRM
jgi:guanylate cyclase